MADDEFDAFADELVGDRDTLFRVGTIVAHEQLNLLSKDAAGGVDVLDRLFGAVLELRAEGSAAAGERARDAHLDLRRRGCRERNAKTNGKAELEPMSHSVHLWMKTRSGTSHRRAASCRDSIRKQRKCHPDFDRSAVVEWSRRRQLNSPVRSLIHP